MFLLLYFSLFKYLMGIIYLNYFYIIQYVESVFFDRFVIDLMNGHHLNFT